MPRLTHHLVPKKELKVTTPSTAVLVTLFFLALFVSSCQARSLLVHDAKASSKEVTPEPSPCKANGSPRTQRKDTWNADARDACLDHDVDAKLKEEVSMASPGTVRTATAGRVSRRLSHGELQREDTAFHLDYDGPMTHTPAHN